MGRFGVGDTCYLKAAFGLTPWWAHKFGPALREQPTSNPVGGIRAFGQVQSKKQNLHLEEESQNLRCCLVMKM